MKKTFVLFILLNLCAFLFSSCTVSIQIRGKEKSSIEETTSPETTGRGASVTGRVLDEDDWDEFDFGSL